MVAVMGAIDAPASVGPKGKERARDHPDRRKPLKRLKTAKAIQGNASLFLGRIWTGAGCASIGLAKFGIAFSARS